MAANREVEIKFRIEDIKPLVKRLKELGFRLITPRTHEMNTLYDLAGNPLRRRGALLRVRSYGLKSTVTYKDRNGIRPGRHKTRREIETGVDDSQIMAQILEASGFKPGFAYEKFRSEWAGGPARPGAKPGKNHGRAATGAGHVVIDETPIGNFGEIEGPPEWIDEVARELGISAAHYITLSYAELFLEWKKKTGSKVTQMRFPVVS